MDRWLTPVEVADEIGLHPDTVRRHLESGELHGHQRMHRGRWQVNPESVEAWRRGMDGVAACGCARLKPVRPTRRAA